MVEAKRPDTTNVDRRFKVVGNTENKRYRALVFVQRDERAGSHTVPERSVVTTDGFPSIPLRRFEETPSLFQADPTFEPTGAERVAQLADTYSWFRPTPLSELATMQGSVPTIDDPFSKESVAARVWDYSTQRSKALNGIMEKSRPGNVRKDINEWKKNKLTLSEFELLYKIASGLEAQDLASALGIAVNTVKNTIASIHGKLGSKTRVHAVSLAEKAGIILTDDLLHGISSPILCEMRNSLLLVIAGITDPEHLQSLTTIANHLNIAPRTIKDYLTELRQILGVNSLVDIYRFARAYEEGKITMFKNSKTEPDPAAVFPEHREVFGAVLNPQRVKEHIAAYARWAEAVAREKRCAVKPVNGDDLADNRVGMPLTQREHEIAYQVALGSTNKKIAAVLGISDRTVKNLILIIMRKVQAGSREAVTVKGFEEMFLVQSAFPLEYDYSGYSHLFNSQKEVFNLLAGGFRNAEIAQNLNITEQTVKNHITGILRKLGVENRRQALLLAAKRKEHMAKKTASDLPFTNEHAARLRMLLFGVSNGIPGPSTSDRLQLLVPLDARTVEEAAGHAIAYGCIAPEALGIPQSVIARAVHLTADQVSFLNAFGSYTTKPFYRRFEKMSLSRDEGMKKLAAAFAILQIPTTTLNSTAAKMLSIAGFVAEVEGYRYELSEQRNRYNDFINMHTQPAATDVYIQTQDIKRKDHPGPQESPHKREAPQISPDR